MKLSEKILYCRKKAGLSQEGLAERIGVSRQAISKWETGDAVPEINKLLTLAKTFGVTTDWLLSEEKIEEGKDEKKVVEKIEDIVEEKEGIKNFNTMPTSNPSWVDSLPGLIGKLLRKFGWLFGVYIALSGAGITLMGGIAKYINSKMFTSFNQSMNNMFSGTSIWYDEFGNQISNPFEIQTLYPIGEQLNTFTKNNPVSIMTTIFIGIGIAMIIGGSILAICLKRYSNKKDKTY